MVDPNAYWTQSQPLRIEGYVMRAQPRIAEWVRRYAVPVTPSLVAWRYGTLKYDPTMLVTNPTGEATRRMTLADLRKTIYNSATETMDEETFPMQRGYTCLDFVTNQRNFLDFLNAHKDKVATDCPYEFYAVPLVDLGRRTPVTLATEDDPRAPRRCTIRDAVAGDAFIKEDLEVIAHTATSDDQGELFLQPWAEMSGTEKDGKTDYRLTRWAFFAVHRIAPDLDLAKDLTHPSQRPHVKLLLAAAASERDPMEVDAPQPSRESDAPKRSASDRGDAEEDDEDEEEGGDGSDDAGEPPGKKART